MEIVEQAEQFEVAQWAENDFVCRLDLPSGKVVRGSGSTKEAAIADARTKAKAEGQTV